jgi:hypothetical protein
VSGSVVHPGAQDQAVLTEHLDRVECWIRVECRIDGVFGSSGTSGSSGVQDQEYEH